MFLDLILGTARDCVNSWADAGDGRTFTAKSAKKKELSPQRTQRNRKGRKKKRFSPQRAQRKAFNAENAEMTKQTQTEGDAVASGSE